MIKTMNNISLKKAADMLLSHNNILVLTHNSPDGDTLGSAFAIKYTLLQKNIMVVCDDNLPERLRFICDNAESLRPERLPRDIIPDFIVSVDTASLALAGGYGKTLVGKIDLKFDHHPMSEEFAMYNYVDTRAAACGEIIFDLIGYLGNLNKNTAEVLYAAISSDTGCFKYRNVTADTHRKTAVLLDTDIDHSDINTKLFENKSFKEMTAARVALESIKFYRNNSVASICFTNAMKEIYDLNDEDIGDISSIPRSITGVVLGVVLKQKQDDPRVYKISMRSGPTVAANDLCAMFGGGGHLRAAGGFIEADNGEEAEKTVMERVLSALGESDAGK